MYNVGDRFTLKNTRDSAVYEIERIIPSFCGEITYELKQIGSGNRRFIQEKTLDELYNSVRRSGG